MRTNLNGILTLLLAFVVHLSFAQDKTISGTVTDQDGLPLPGVNILVDGTTKGTQTDFDGNYSISASEGQVLLFTYIGQKPSRAVLGVSTSVNVVMELDAQALEEVVVTALGIKRSEKSIGYAVQNLKGESIAETQEPNLINALTGKVSGAQITNSSGASVYSASKVAREEFPDHDLTVRGAVSIGRRLMDPLAELVKIDPKSIGVGQYQHDVDQTALKQSLDDVVTSCVNNVGVDLNRASAQLLTYVSGLNAGIAKNIVLHRDTNGPFQNRKQLLKVPRLGPHNPIVTNPIYFG